MKFTELEEESRPQLVNRLLLNMRLKNKEAFENAMESGFLYFGEKKLLYILQNDFEPKLEQCTELDTYIKWVDSCFRRGK